MGANAPTKIFWHPRAVHEPPLPRCARYRCLTFYVLKGRLKHKENQLLTFCKQLIGMVNVLWKLFVE